MEDKIMERFQCVYYNHIAQSYEIIEIAAKNRKEALMVAYLATGFGLRQKADRYN